MERERKERGEGVENEGEESEEGEEEYLRECLKKAEEEVSAKEELTFCLYFGHRSNSNEEEAERWCFEGIEEKSVFCEAFACYCEWKSGLNALEVFKMFEECLEEDLLSQKKVSILAANMLGVMCLEGEALQRNYSLAMHFFSLSASRGDQFAELRIADLFKLGRGVQRNLSKAREVYERLSERGNMDGVVKKCIARE